MLRSISEFLSRNRFSKLRFVGFLGRTKPGEDYAMVSLYNEILLQAELADTPTPGLCLSAPLITTSQGEA